MKIRLVIFFAFVFVSTTTKAQLIGFSCNQHVPKKFTWHWDLLIDKTSRKGTMNGVTYAGRNDEIQTPYSWPLQITFTPEHLFFQKIGDSHYQGTINRKTLDMDYGGGKGKCKIVPVKEGTNLF